MINIDKYNIIDISMKLENGVLSWPGNRHNFRHHYAMKIDFGGNANVSRIESSMHTGTHLDTPFHKINDGKKLHEISEKNFMGSAQVIDLTSIHNTILLDDIENKIDNDVEIILLKTSNSKLLQNNKFNDDYVCLDAKASKYLSEQNIKAVCVDYLSIDKFNSEDSINHHTFLEKNIIIYEAVDLYKVNEGRYFFIGLPIKIDNADGALVRALLLEEKR
mgnify:CR=1 FL=1|tara:strand:- start:1973 stop:2629 length:657 start_codon:yes stop_codon:yes gene_type:complete